MNFTPFPFGQLLDWYEQNGRHDLPWRQYFHVPVKDLTYHIWLSEILLQQTQASRVASYYTKILERFPTIEHLASCTYEEFFPYYQGLGYYSRARNLLKTAGIVVADYRGIFPDNQKELLTLPGVGPYTASAILAFAHEKPILALDTNIQKIFARYYFGDKKAHLPHELILTLEKQIIDEKLSARRINAALMDLAAAFINYPKDSSYPLPGCRWIETSGELEAHSQIKTESFPLNDANIIIILHEDHKKYLSEKSSEYQPFILAPCRKINLRHHVQHFFLERFGLTLSVRPPHDRFFKQTLPYVVCNAQIQTGNNQFKIYTKKDVQDFWKRFLQK